MSDELTVYQKLAAPFADTHTKTISGRTLTYISGEQCTTRLNEVLGFDGWSFEVKENGITILEDEVWAVGRLTIFVDGKAIVREQSGGQIINRKSGIPAQPARPAQDADGDRPAIPAVEAKPAVKGDVIELSNDIKGAVTDCMKKCASLVGVGLYLSERGAGGQSAATRPPARGNAPKPTPISGSKSEARLKLEAAWQAGLVYARNLGLTPNEDGILDLDDAKLTEVLDGLRSQCKYVQAERKKAAV